jgi:hypothetical protein
VSHQEAICSLHQKGWSQRRIARELGINRRYTEGEAKCASLSTPSSGEPMEAKCTTISIPGADEKSRWSRWLNHGAARDGANPLRQRLTRDEGWAERPAYQRIYQDLIEENGFSGSYQSIKRFVRRLRQKQPERVWCVECQPGEEMQVDFCLGAPLEGDDGKRRRSWVLRAVLSYSRKGYSEAVLRQDTESFLRCLENALHQYGQIVEVDRVVERLRVSVVIHDLEAFADRTGFQFLVLDRDADFQSFFVTLGRVRCIYFGWSRLRPRNRLHGEYSILGFGNRPRVFVFSQPLSS